MRKVTNLVHTVAFTGIIVILCGCEEKEAEPVIVTPDLPSVKTVSISDITDVSVTALGMVHSEGSEPVTSRGMVWGRHENPCLEKNDSMTTDKGGYGLYQSKIYNLQPRTLYYLRPYATSIEGSAYGDQVSFSTRGKITDNDGNAYYTVIIGEQEWMSENLKTTTYSDGEEIPYIFLSGEWQQLSTGAYCWYSNRYNIYHGALYNWHAVETGKLCPSGWHVPTDEDWQSLIDHLGGRLVAGGKLKSTRTVPGPGWNFPNSGATDEVGFNALAGGSRFVSGRYECMYSEGNWWSATDCSTLNAGYFVLSYSNSIAGIDNEDKRRGFSVRCIRD